MWSTKEGTWEGKTYDEFEDIARDVMVREGTWDTKYIPLTERKEE